MPQKSLEGTISAENINKYGNVTIDMDEQAFRDAGFEEGDIVTVTIGEKTIDMPFVTDYQDVKRGEPLLVPAEGKLAMWISMGSFAETYEIAERIDSKANSVVWKMSEKLLDPEPVTVSMKQKAGYLEEYTLRRDLAGLTPITELTKSLSISERLQPQASDPTHCIVPPPPSMTGWDEAVLRMSASKNTESTISSISTTPKRLPRLIPVIRVPMPLR